jgi:HAD superfamily hydrolase (TIGR01509 family)
MPTAYLLDLYDTLVHGDWMAWRSELAALTGASEDALATAYETTRGERNEGAFESPEEEVRALLGAGGMPDADATLVAKVIQAEASFGERIQLYDDTLPALAGLRADGSPIAIVSNCSRGTRETIERLGLDAAVDAVVLSCELRARKRDPRIYREALQALDAEPADAIFVDDQTAYCDGARALGISTRLIVRPGAAPPEGFAPSTNGHRVISGLGELR